MKAPGEQFFYDFGKFGFVELYAFNLKYDFPYELYTQIFESGSHDNFTGWLRQD